MVYLARYPPDKVIIGVLTVSGVFLLQEKNFKAGVTAAKLDVDARPLIGKVITGLRQTSQQLALLEGCLLVSAEFLRPEC